MTTVLLFGRGAKLLSGGVVLSGADTVRVDLLANEGWHGLGVVLETRAGVVGAASAGVVQSILLTIRVASE